MSKKFLIAGAGIAGLTLAKILQDLNYDYEIFEASSEVRGIGAGFGLASNAMKAFEILGLAEEVAPLGHMLEDFEIQDWKDNGIILYHNELNKKNQFLKLKESFLQAVSFQSPNRKECFFRYQ